MSAELEALKQKRLNWVEANRDNGFDEGINRLLTELYPDNAHFIYELLQNAEDPQATEVQFILTNSSVKFTHNGERLFTFKDVESITSIGNSTKRDDATSIGKFGVGFKAVFAYTNTPEIHSGDFHFRIRDLVVPDIEGVTRTTSEINQTCFLFPFDNPKKPAVTAMKDIKKGLQALGDNSLLFLSHIRKIDYTLPDGSKGSLERIPHDNGRIEIHTNKPPYSEKEISHWLHFHKDVEVNDENGNTKICRIAIAYQLEQTTDKNKEKTGWKIVSVEHGGQVSIYFPAEKETSKLRFHIHAPFASTVARDSVRDCNDNEQLRDHLAELIVESLTMIRDQGMLTMSFLAVLPNLKDELAEFYEPIRTKIVDAFNNNDLTPKKSGCYSPAKFLYRGLTKISDVILDSDLAVLLIDEHNKQEIYGWVANLPPQHQRAESFLDNLSIKRLGFEQLLTIFGEELSSLNKFCENSFLDEYPSYLRRIDRNNFIKYLSTNAYMKEDYDEHCNLFNLEKSFKDKNKKIKLWLEQKNDDWLMSFYALLDESTYRRESINIEFPLVRVNSKDGIKHVKSNEAYFEPLHSDISANGIQIVKREVYTKDNAKCDIDENAESFLKRIGVRPFDITAAIGQLLNRYKDPRPNFNTYDHYDDIKQFVRYWKEHISLESWSRPTGFNEMYGRFKTESFLLCTLDNKSVWQKASEICLDGEIFKTGLAEFTKIHQKLPIWNNYVKKLNENELQDFVDFLKAIGAMYCLAIEKLTELEAKNHPEYPYKNPGKYTTGHARDYSIMHLEKYLLTKRIPASKLIWDAVIHHNGENVTEASFQLNRNYVKKDVESQLIYYLKKYSWIPNKEKTYIYPPSRITLDDLPDDFPFNNTNGLLTAIEFGKTAKDKEEKEKRLQEQATASFKEKEKNAQELGFDSASEAEEAARLTEELGGIANVREIAARRNKSTEQPEESVPNPERRRKNVLERSENAPSKESVMRERSIQQGIATVTAEAKAYLRVKYTNANHELVCQCCQQEMPFKIGDAYYFEAVQCLKKVDKHHIENHLALCPICAAMYKHARIIEDSELRSLLIEHNTQENATSAEIPLMLAGKEYFLRFVGTHFFDLQTVLGEE